MVVVRLHYAKSDAGTVVCVMSLYDDIRDVPLAPLTYENNPSLRTLRSLAFAVQLRRSWPG